MDEHSKHESQQQHGDHSINVCFSTTDSWLSKLIRFGADAPVSHALITFEALTFRKAMVMEAVTAGYRIVPWKKWIKKNHLFERYGFVPKGGASQAEQCAALETMADALGAGYDFTGLLGFFKLFFIKADATEDDPGRDTVKRNYKRRIKAPWQNPSRLFCSEAVAKFLNEAGVAGFEKPAEMRPDLLLKAVRERPEIFELLENRAGPTAAGIEAQGRMEEHHH